jgi:hypothetical protein
LFYPSQPFLEAQLRAAEGESLISKADMATALQALIGVLPDLVEDVPKAPLLAAEMAGQLIATGLVPLSLADLAKAVKEAGAEDAGGEEGEEMDPALIDQEKAVPMLLTAANAIKVSAKRIRSHCCWKLHSHVLHFFAMFVVSMLTNSALLLLLLLVVSLQAASGEDAAKAAWKDSKIDLESLLPSFTRDSAAEELPKLFAKYDAQYLA